MSLSHLSHKGGKLSVKQWCWVLAVSPNIGYAPASDGWLKEERGTGRLNEPSGAQMYLEKALRSWSVGARKGRSVLETVHRGLD